MQNPAAVVTQAPASPASLTYLTTAPITIPPLNEGERWIGIVSVGAQLHHVILLAGDFEGNWKAAIAWAKEQGGEIPTRLEQALLWVEAKDQFKSDWYWSCEQHASHPSYAWVESFDYGLQTSIPMVNYCRARAVRRIPIQ